MHVCVPIVTHHGMPAWGIEDGWALRIEKAPFLFAC